MIALIRYFLSQAKPRLFLLLGCVFALFYAAGLAMGGLISGAAIAASLFTSALVQAVFLVVGVEFVMVLPFKRADVFTARILAIAVQFAAMWLPLAAAFVVAADRGEAVGAAKGMTNLATYTFAFLALSQCLWAIPRFRERFVGAQGIVEFLVLLGVCVSGAAVIIHTTASLLPSAIAVAVIVVSVPLGRRLVRRFELVPAADVRPDSRQRGRAEPAPARRGLVDRLPAFPRFMARSVWLRWWYLLGVLWVCTLMGWGSAGFVRRADNTGTSILVQLMLFALFFAPLQLSQLAGLLALPCSRITIFRSMTGPWLAAALVVTAAAGWIVPKTIDRYCLSKGDPLTTLPVRMRIRVIDSDNPGGVIRIKGAHHEPAPAGGLPPARIARLVADDIADHYGLTVDPAELLQRDAGGTEWTIDSDSFLPRAVGRVVWSSGLFCTCVLLWALWLALPAGKNIRSLHATGRSKYLALLVGVGGVYVVLRLLKVIPPIPIPRTFAIAHFWPLLVVLATACGLFWWLAGRGFCDLEIAEKGSLYGRKML